MMRTGKSGEKFLLLSIYPDKSGIEDGKGVIFVKDLPWRHKRVTNFFQKLDDEHNSKRSEQANRQTKVRVKKKEKGIYKSCSSRCPYMGIIKDELAH